MPSKERIKASFIDDFLQSRSEEAGLAPKTISKYRVVLTQAVEALDEAGLNCYPRKIGKIEINHLRKNHFIENSKSIRRAGCSVSTS